MRYLFVADLHARPDQPGRERIFRFFLESSVNEGDHLFLLGDIFEFGFVFQGRILPYYQNLVDCLAGLRKKGVEVTFLGGNHDVWMGQFFKQINIGVIPDGHKVNIAGYRIQLFHGILREKDSLSRMASRLMKNPDAVWIYSLLPSRIGFGLALKAARASRQRSRMIPQRFQPSLLKSIDSETDIVISAHHHLSACFEYQGKRFILTGDWIKDFTYLEISDKVLELKSFPVDKLFNE
jgi:UDP-2,3-diacylglucosamine hydrolase